MAEYKVVKVPKDGAKITLGANKQLNVPDNPIIPFIEGDGTGRDIWRASARVFDAAVERAYNGKAQNSLDGSVRGREVVQNVQQLAARRNGGRRSRNFWWASKARSRLPSVGAFVH